MTAGLDRDIPPGPEASPDEWEVLCKRCGLCCFEKETLEDGTILVTDRPCRFLDVLTRECKIYERRFEGCRDCLPVTWGNLPELTWLPDSCGYVEHLNLIFGNSAWRKPAKVIWPGR